MKTEVFDLLNVKVYPTRDEMGIGAGKHLEAVLQEVIKDKGEARVIFASAPSQNEALAYLVDEADVDWSKVVGFHMDEYVGLPADAPQSFSRFIEEKLLSKVSFKEWHPMLTDGDIDKRIADYLALLEAAPIDLVILGIGENGHLAFIDPPVCDFNDPDVLKVVELDPVNRQQQVNDGAFKTLDEVPTTALTMTIPFLMKSTHKIAIVPGPTKQTAIKNTVLGDVSTACPASILRKHHSYLYTDKDGYHFVENK